MENRSLPSGAGADPGDPFPEPGLPPTPLPDEGKLAPFGIPSKAHQLLDFPFFPGKIPHVVVVN